MRFLDCFTIDLRARTGGPAPGWGALLLRLLLNPGYRAVVYYRIAGYLRAVRYPRRLTNLTAALLTARLSRVPGVEIHARATIAPGLSLPHPHDIVIGAGARIGECATLYNGVTLGARDLKARDTVQDESERYPALGDNVTVFTGAKLLGPVRIGAHSTIGANCVVLKSFPEKSVLVGIPARNLADVETGSGDDS